MSEQPANIYNLNDYPQPVHDGSVVMDDETHVDLKASQLPLRRASLERPRELTEAERLAYEIRMTGSKLHELNEERRRRLAA